MKQYSGQRCFEWLKHHKVGISWKKVIRKGLKRARSLLSGIRSLQANTIFRWLELTKTEDPEKNNWQNFLHQWSVISLAAAKLVSSLTEKKKWERCVGTTDSNCHGQRRLSLEQQLYYLIMRVFWGKRRVHAIFAVVFVFKSGSDSTRLWWIGLQLVSI